MSCSRLCKLLAVWLVVASCLVTMADFTGFPLKDNTNAYDWFYVRTNINPIGQIYSATVERCHITGLAAPSLEQSWSVFAGVDYITNHYIVEAGLGIGITYSLTNATNNAAVGPYANSAGYRLWKVGGQWRIYNPSPSILYQAYCSDDPPVGTNWYDITDVLIPGAFSTNWFTSNEVWRLTNIITTNAFNYFTYNYTDVLGSHTGTNYTYITRSFMAALDAAITNLVPYFVVTNEAVGGSYSNWFAKSPPPEEFPVESVGGLFTRQGIGFATNQLTNTWGVITSAMWAAYTRYPQSTQEWVLGEAYYTGVWRFTQIKTNDLLSPDTNGLPILRYLSSSCFSHSVSILGEVYKPGTTNMTVVGTTETVTATGTNTALTLGWHRVTNITTTAGLTGDVFAVAWTNARIIYGARPFQLSAEDLDERWKTLGALVYTCNDAQFGGDPNGTNYYGKQWLSPYTDTWDNAMNYVSNNIPADGFKTLAIYGPGQRLVRYRNTDYGGDTFYAVAGTIKGRYYSDFGLGTNATLYERQADWYFRSEKDLHDAITDVWDNCDHVVSTNNFVPYTDGNILTTNGFLTNWIGWTDFPPRWPAAPAAHTLGEYGTWKYTTKGWVMNEADDEVKVLLRWNISTNGLRYK